MWHCLWESYLTIIHVFQRDALYARDESRLKALLSFRDLSILSGPGRRLLSSSRARVFATLVFSEFIQLRMNGPEIAFPHLVAFRADLTPELFCFCWFHPSLLCSVFPTSGCCRRSPCLEVRFGLKLGVCWEVAEWSGKALGCR
jgi:hypothetical protein